MIIHECLYSAVFAQGFLLHLSYSYDPGFLESKLNSVHMDCYIARNLFQTAFVMFSLADYFVDLEVNA